MLYRGARRCVLSIPQRQKPLIRFYFFGKNTMWLARLFGAHASDDSEPAKFPPHQPASRKSAAPGRARMQKPQGFDPYNSGAFRKASAWERVHRR